MALGSDVLSTALDGYSLANAAGKGTALDALRGATSSRNSRRRKNGDAPPAGEGRASRDVLPSPLHD